VRMRAFLNYRDSARESRLKVFNINETKPGSELMKGKVKWAVSDYRKLLFFEPGKQLKSVLVSSVES